MSTNNNTCHNQRVAKDPVMVPISFLLGTTKQFGKKKGENGLFVSCGQSIGASALASVLPKKNIQD